MLMRCVVRDPRGRFLTNRKATGEMYVNRSMWSKDINQAKVFNTKGSATNSARYNLGNDGVFEVLEVELTIVEN